MALLYPTIYKRIKALLAELAKKNPNEIKAHMALKQKPLNYDSTGLRALAPKLEERFSDQNLRVKEDKAERFTNVRSIARLVHEKIGRSS